MKRNRDREAEALAHRGQPTGIRGFWFGDVVIKKGKCYSIPIVRKQVTIPHAE